MNFNLKIPKHLHNKLDLRDLVPIIMNCPLNENDVYKIAEADIDIYDNKYKIIQLACNNNSIDDIIATLNHQPQ